MGRGFIQVFLIIGILVMAGFIVFLFFQNKTNPIPAVITRASLPPSPRLISPGNGKANNISSESASLDQSETDMTELDSQLNAMDSELLSF